MSFDPDIVLPQINAHAVPHLDITVIHHQRPTGERLIVLDVAQFRDYPVMCSRPIVSDNGRVLASQGRLLVRSRRTNETTELQAPEDLRELIDLAVEKGLEVYFRRRLIEAAAAQPTDAQRFAVELGPLIA